MDHNQQVLAGRTLRTGGFTLIEAVVGTFIITILMLGFSYMLISQNQTLAEETQETNAQMYLRQALDNAVFELQEARFVAVSYNGSPAPTGGSIVNPKKYAGNGVIYQIPKRMTDGSGRIQVDAATAWGVEWGVGGNDGTPWTPGGFYWLQLITTTEKICKGPVADETIMNLDINGDGDMSDSFFTGYLRLTRTDLVGWFKDLPGKVVVVDDRIFVQVGEDYDDTNMNGRIDGNEKHKEIGAGINPPWEIGLRIRLTYIDPNNTFSNYRMKAYETEFKFRNNVDQ